MIPSQRDRSCRASPRYLHQADSIPALLRLFHCHLESNLSAVSTSGSARSLPGSTRQLILDATRSIPITPDSLVDPQPQQEPDTTFLDNRNHAGPGRDALLCRDSLELPPRRRLVPSAHPPFAVFMSPRASSSSSSSTLSDQAGPPSVRELAAFIKRILKLAKTDAECIIMTLVCIERLLTATRGRLEIQRDVAPHGHLLPHLEVKRYF
ncbi:hypothetical protein PsorP6_008019 [Peronosclerospora sorghi]|uniref:Uncharacterized protein n=1 Tax=Peronosclerospora sorghi TaxID=230839 RepID=A0ACC0W816_9STRA|nr:hypothetical protein PsorP6_008019 [Peronosclerospora sorghi]